ncbi:MAG: TetR/AcrR family transcriptional regulator [Alkalibacterium sp.]|nr:TetR/AcrR family transcriptional regulator [Alkalibacterium sp.]
MPRKRRILKHHILDASLDLMRQEGFDRFTARKIAECLNASTQPIYKEFKNMDDLKIHLTDYVIDFLNARIFKFEESELQIREVCTNYILFAKQEGRLFAALFMGRELCATTLHESIYDSLHEVLSYHELAGQHTKAERNELLDIIWPAVHGYAILTAQGKYNMSEEELINKINHIIDNSIKVWHSGLAA